MKSEHVNNLVAKKKKKVPIQMQAFVHCYLYFIQAYLLV